MKTSPKPPAGGGAPVVYVVDDDSAVREALGSLIRSVDLRVESFGSAKEFLQHTRPAAPACRRRNRPADLPATRSSMSRGHIGHC